MMFAAFIFLISYWQQTADYDIRAELDIDHHTLTAVEYLTYFNNSPFDIETLYCHLYANAFRDGATVFIEETRRIYSEFAKLDISEYGYIDISNIFWGECSLDFEVKGTLLIIPLQGCLQQGESVCLKINFEVKIPEQSSRLGYQGDHYEMVQWYPKVCVFDDQGWHLDGCLHRAGGSAPFGGRGRTMDCLRRPGCGLRHRRKDPCHRG